jgi:hypothetical protein
MSTIVGFHSLRAIQKRDAVLKSIEDKLEKGMVTTDEEFTKLKNQLKQTNAK